MARPHLEPSLTVKQNQLLMRTTWMNLQGGKLRKKPMPKRCIVYNSTSIKVRKDKLLKMESRFAIGRG